MKFFFKFPSPEGGGEGGIKIIKKKFNFLSPEGWMVGGEEGRTQIQIPEPNHELLKKNEKI